MSKVIDILEMELDEELPYWLSTEAQSSARLDEIKARKRADAQTAYANQTKTKAALRQAKKLLRAWDESEHPREPAGSPEGGEFAGGGGSGGGSDSGDDKPSSDSKPSSSAHYARTVSALGTKPNSGGIKEDVVLYRGVEGGTNAQDALRHSPIGDIGAGIYLTPSKRIAASFGGGPSASVAGGTRVVHQYGFNRELKANEVARVFDGKKVKEDVRIVRGDGTELYKGPWGSAQMESALSAHPEIAVVVGTPDSIGLNQVSVRDRSVIEAAALAAEAPPHATVSGYSPGVKASGSDKAVKAVKQEWVNASPIKTLDQLVAAAPPAQKQLGDVGREIGAKYGVQFKDPGVKTKDAEGIARTQVKIAERGGVPARVTDVARATFIINKPEQADQIAAELGKHFEVTHENWKLTDLGYFDRTANVRMPNGTIAEVQMMDANMANAKSSKEKGGGGGHDLYVQSRDLVSSKNPADKEKYDSLVAAQQALYGSVAANYPADWKAAYMKAAADQAS